MRTKFDQERARLVINLYLKNNNIKKKTSFFIENGYNKNTIYRILKRYDQNKYIEYKKSGPKFMKRKLIKEKKFKNL